jgi:hypothetical protein
LISAAVTFLPGATIPTLSPDINDIGLIMIKNRNTRNKLASKTKNPCD